MHFRMYFVAAVAALTYPVICNASALVKRLITSLPASDPFYIPPAGFASQPPGTVLRTRTILPSSVLADLMTSAYQFLYRTTALNGSAIATVATVFVPSSPYNDRFIHFATAYDSAWTGCDPSYNYQLGSTQTDALLNLETTLIDTYLKTGYIVVSSDYEGPDAAFSAGHLSGQCLLDSMRAVQNSSALLGLKADPMVVGVGYSGGAIATGWAASLQPTYAPELNMKGWVVGGTPANLTGVLMYIDDTAYSGFLPSALAGLSAPSTYGATMVPFMDSILTPAGAAYVAYAQSHCGSDEQNNFMSKSVFSTDFQSMGPEFIYAPVMQQVMGANIMGQHASETPAAPVLIYHCEQDEIIPFANTTTLVNNWCHYGANVNFTVFENGGHVSGAATGFLYQVGFVHDAFAGQLTSSPSCTTTFVDNVVGAPA